MEYIMAKTKHGIYEQVEVEKNSSTLSRWVNIVFNLGLGFVFLLCWKKMSYFILTPKQAVECSLT